MAVVVYSNGITEEYVPQDLVFTDEELVFLFTEFPTIKSCRVSSMVNTWCLYGSGNDNVEDFNRLVSEITGERVFTHALFIHDSEINPYWKMTDEILFKNYAEFLKEIKKNIEEISIMIMNEIVKTDDYDKKVDNLPQLITLGVTNDDSKRILFAFNPDDQNREFYYHEEFSIFSKKVYDYLKEHKQTESPFTIWADKKAIIIIESEKIKTFLQTLIENFKETEEYEICTNITNMMEDWFKLHPEKTKSSKENE